MPVTTRRPDDFTTVASETRRKAGDRCECTGLCGGHSDGDERCTVRHQPHPSAGTISLLVTTRRSGRRVALCFTCQEATAPPHHCRVTGPRRRTGVGDALAAAHFPWSDA